MMPLFTNDIYVRSQAVQNKLIGNFTGKDESEDDLHEWKKKSYSRWAENKQGLWTLWVEGVRSGVAFSCCPDWCCGSSSAFDKLILLKLHLHRRSQCSLSSHHTQTLQVIFSLKWSCCMYSGILLCCFILGEETDFPFHLMSFISVSSSIFHTTSVLLKSILNYSVLIN